MTRSDLSPGQQATQSTHAAFKFAHDHPALTDIWYQESTYLVLLSVPAKDDLLRLADMFERADHPASIWTEPDMGDETTAVAIAPGIIASRMLANLPLTLREPAMT